MTTPLEKLETSVGALLALERSASPEHIREIISAFRKTSLFENVDDDSAEHLARTLEARLGVTMTIGAVLTSAEYEPWLDSAKAGIDTYYWNRYRKLLVQQKFSGDVISALDAVTDRILGQMENPERQAPWNRNGRRGMVVGHVQSGKTANYTGLICKAADAGYKLIVVIAGIHNNLRNQTQTRIDEGFIGRDSTRLLSKQADLHVGVGTFDKTRNPVTFTNSQRDFNKPSATAVGISLDQMNEPAVFVIKKNSSTLANLIDWLKAYSVTLGSSHIDAPMLVIDDEADNASINVKYPRDEVSKINGQIRDLLKTFSRSCYVGYTATPFANIFIDPDTKDEMLNEDLFPRDFIVSLDPPSNYFGPETVFPIDGSEYIRHIEDNEDVLPIAHKIDFHTQQLPSSLKDAIRTFVIARTTRLIRGHRQQHCSMLVNASRFTNVQVQLSMKIHEFLSEIQAAVKVNAGKPVELALQDHEVMALHERWATEYPGAGTTWHSVQGLLYEAVAPIRVEVINSGSSGKLNYSDYKSAGLSVIAIGGYALSRGLTLEGLMVSYFLRNSKMYDTLMQMGRWFGYRPGYEDLCRIWMPESAEGWYQHITESIEELRAEIRAMQAANATPADFGLKVRSHPDTLVVTARNKMGAGEIRRPVGLSNRLLETYAVSRLAEDIQANQSAAMLLVEALKGSGIDFGKVERAVSGDGYLIKGVSASFVIDFLLRFRNHPSSIHTVSEPVVQYIRERGNDELAVWDVLFPSLRATPAAESPDQTLGIPIWCQMRTAGKDSDLTRLLLSNRQRVSSRGIEKNGLNPVEIAEAERNSETVQKGSTGSINYPDRIYRAARKRPLLMVHTLRVKVPNGPNEQEQIPQTVLAWGISFPVTYKTELLTEYVVDRTWIREMEAEYQLALDEDGVEGDN